MKAYRVYSDNYNGTVMSVAAYKELTLQMSTGDYGAHKAEEIDYHGPESCLFLDDISETGCGICERHCKTSKKRVELNGKVCDLCHESYQLRHERFPYETKLKQLTDKFNSYLSYKQYKKSMFKEWYKRAKVTKSKKALAVLAEIIKCLSILTAYTQAEREIDSQIKALGGFKNL